MRLLWIHRESAEAEGGAIYDDKMRRALSAAGHEITPYALKRNKRARQLARAAAHASLPEQYGVGCAQDEAALRALLAQPFGAVVFSHEHLDAMAARLRPHAGAPFVSIRHNVTSDAMAQILGDAPALGKLYRTLAERQERAALRGPLFDGIVAVSERDRALLKTLSGGREIALAMPGAPPAVDLAEGAPCMRALAISGTFDWFAKAKDLRAFTAAHAADPLSEARLYISDGAPAAIRASLKANSESELAWGEAIRFGLITDRFAAGHKLKTAAYLMNNCAVFTFAPVIHDFAFSPLAARWIYKVQTIADIRAIMNAVMLRPAAELREELTALKGEIAVHLAWERQAQAIAALLEALPARPSAENSVLKSVTA